MRHALLSALPSLLRWRCRSIIGNETKINFEHEFDKAVTNIFLNFNSIHPPLALITSSKSLNFTSSMSV